jgi:hypothetical protein
MDGFPKNGAIFLNLTQKAKGRRNGRPFVER